MKTPFARSRAGFSLVEVALAMGIAAFCLIPLFGLLPIGINASRDSVEQTGAVNVALAVVSDLRAIMLTIPPASQTSPFYGVPVPATLPGSATLFVRQDGTLSGKVNSDAKPAEVPHYRVSLYFASAAPGSSASSLNNATTVRVLITWPALADAKVSADPAQFSGSFETLAALIRN